MPIEVPIEVPIYVLPVQPTEEPTASRFREEWALDIGARLQRLVGALLGAEREEFEEAFRAFARLLPEPIAIVEALWLRDKLSGFCSRAAADFHIGQHEYVSLLRCGFTPLAGSASRWSGAPKSARFLVRLWVARYLTAFDGSHPVQSLPARAARLLRRSTGQMIQIDQLARKLGTSRPVLVRVFERRFGLTPKAYETRVRMRSIVVALRASDVKVECAALCAGYRGQGSFYKAFGRATGLTPLQIRAISHVDARVLLAGALEINPAALLLGSRA